MQEFGQPPVERTVVPFLRLFRCDCDIAHSGGLRFPISVKCQGRCEKNAHSSHENLVAFIDAEVGVAEENLASVLSAQRNNLVAEDLEVEALARVLSVAGHEEVITALEEVPSMVGLEARKPGELALLTLGTEGIDDGGRGEDGGHTSDAGIELVVLADDGVEEGGVEGRHGS